MHIEQDQLVELAWPALLLPVQALLLEIAPQSVSSVPRTFVHDLVDLCLDDAQRFRR